MSFKAFISFGNYKREVYRPFGYGEGGTRWHNIFRDFAMEYGIEDYIARGDYITFGKKEDALLAYMSFK